MEYVSQTYRAFWCDGRDISDPSVLAQLMTEHLANKADGESCRIAWDWETAWHETGQPGVPLIVSPDGDLLVGCVPVEEIRRFFV
jgi:predicted DsbA family dithiol-disulfide isomerase